VPTLGFRRAIAAVLLLAALLLLPTVASAATPSPTPLSSGDPRGGTAPSLTGDPLLAAAGVILLGLATAGLAILYVRLGRE
jgi:hypothetical protein